ncbi:MAG: DUF6463 family protein [Propionibacteriaceae bacterium]|nr:DUF6463 family protein [Propionibacteriaceae bacterium]
MKSKNRPVVAWCLTAVGLIHTAFGLVLGWGVLADGVRRGFIGAWEAPPQSTLFWFLMSGFLLIATAPLAGRLERSATPLPWSFIAALGILAAVGCVAMPASGFWLVALTTTVAAARRARHH